MKENKVVVILNYLSGSIDFLNYPEKIENEVLDKHDGNIEVYLSLKHNYPTSSICYMVSTWERIEGQLHFNDPNIINTRSNND